jgi:hypothetical protein
VDVRFLTPPTGRQASGFPPQEFDGQSDASNFGASRGVQSLLSKFFCLIDQNIKAMHFALS